MNTPESSSAEPFRLIRRRALGRVAVLALLLALACAAPAAASDVYVANQNSDNVSQYDVGPGGALAAKATPTVAAGDGPIWVAVSPDGQSVYVANFDSGNVSQYDVGAGGALAAKATPTVAAGEGPFGVAVRPGGQVEGKISARGTVEVTEVGDEVGVEQLTSIGFSAANRCSADLSTRPSIVGTTEGVRIWTKSTVSESSCTDQPPDSPLGFDTQTATATGTFGPAAPGGLDGEEGTLEWTYYDGGPDGSPDTVLFTLRDSADNVVLDAAEQTPGAYRGAPGGVWTFGP